MATLNLDKKKSELEIKMISDKKDWKQMQDKAFNKLILNLEIKGFRKGKVPPMVAKKNISQQKILTEALSMELDSLAKKAYKNITKDIIVLDGPTYKIDKISDAELEITFTYPVYPEFVISDYKNLNVKYEPKKLDSKKMQDEIEGMKKMHSSLKEKEGSLEKGDTAIFDFEGFLNGKPFENGKGEKYTLEIGSGKFIPGFEDEMIGLKKNEEKEIKVQFPKEYPAKELKGKITIFKVKIHEIKSKQVPELNDDLVKKFKIKDVKTVEEFNKYVNKVFTNQNEQVAKNEFQKKAFDKILEKTTISLPEALVTKEMNKIAKEFEEEIKKQALSLKKYIEQSKTSQEALDLEFKKQAVKKLNDSLIFAEIAKIEKIELTDKDYENEYKNLAKVYGQSEEGVKGMITKEQIQIPLTNHKVIELLINSNK